MFRNKQVKKLFRKEILVMFIPLHGGPSGRPGQTGTLDILDPGDLYYSPWDTQDLYFEAVNNIEVAGLQGSLAAKTAFLSLFSIATIPFKHGSS